MIDFFSCNYLIKLLIALWYFFLLLYSTYYTFWAAKHFQTLIGFCSFVSILAEYLILQCLIGNISANISVSFLKEICDRIGAIPYYLIAGCAAIFTLLNIYLHVSKHKWTNNNITNNSIKYAVERLPVGVCAYYGNGQIVLSNTFMDNIYKEICNENLYNGKLLEKHVLPDIKGKHIIHLNSGNTFQFSYSMVEDNNRKINIIMAEDISEKYLQKEILTVQKENAEEISLRLRQYNKDMVSIIAAKERLNAKVKIHDSLGITLLEIKNYLINGGNETTKKEILSSLKENIQFLRQESEPAATDEYTAIFDAAANLNLTININRELPSEDTVSHIVATAMHECLTNTVRHANGDTLNVIINEDENQYIINFTNNGNPPSDNILEKGGLASLRKLTEDNHGSMTISNKNGFQLTLSLPKEK